VEQAGSMVAGFRNADVLGPFAGLSCDSSPAQTNKVVASAAP